MENVLPVVTSSETPDNLSQFVEQVATWEPEDSGKAWPYYEAAIKGLDQFQDDPEYASAKTLFQAFSLQYQAIDAVSTRSEFQNAAEILAEAHDRFTDIGFINNANVARGMQLAMQANVELRQGNAGSAQKMLAASQELLESDPKQSRKYAVLIDAITFGSLSISSLQAVQMMNFAEGKVLSEEASAKAEAYARNYFDEGTPPHFLYLGLAKLQRALFQLYKAQADLAIFVFDEELSDTDLAKTGREARALLAQAAPQIPIAADSYRLSKAVAGILEVLPASAALVKALVSGLPAPQMDYATMKAHLKLAKDAAAEGGKASLPFFLLCERAGDLMENLRAINASRSTPVARPMDPLLPIQLFVIMPFAEESKTVELALRSVLEDDPYWFKISLARDLTLKPNLLDNVKAHMHLADAFLADITGLNPNVMMELGMVEGDPARRPVFVLKRKTENDPKELDVPSDLKGKLYIEYTLAATADREEAARVLAAELRLQFANMAELTNLAERPHKLHTSVSYLQRKLKQKRMQLSTNELASLGKSFSTVEELSAATPEAIAMKTGFDDDLASALAKIFAAPRIARPAG